MAHSLANCGMLLSGMVPREFSLGGAASLKRSFPYLLPSLCLISCVSFSPLHAQDTSDCLQWTYDHNGKLVCKPEVPVPTPPLIGQAPLSACARWGYDYNGNRVCVAFSDMVGPGPPLADRDQIAVAVESAKDAEAAVERLEAGLNPLTTRVKSLEDRLKTFSTAEDSAAAVKSLDGRLTAVENSLGSGAHGEATTVRSLAERIKSLEDRLKTFPTAGDSAAVVKALDGRLSAVENSVASAANAQESVKSLERRIRSLEDRPNNTLGGVTEALRANLRLVPNECKFDSNNHRCSAQCSDDEMVVSGGCYTLNDNAGGIVASTYLSSETGPSNQYKTWACQFYDMKDIYPDWPPLTRIVAVAYCAKLP
jgi:phage shock protein A